MSYTLYFMNWDLNLSCTKEITEAIMGGLLLVFLLSPAQRRIWIDCQRFFKCLWLKRWSLISCWRKIDANSCSIYHRLASGSGGLLNNSFTFTNISLCHGPATHTSLSCECGGCHIFHGAAGEVTLWCWEHTQVLPHLLSLHAGFFQQCSLSWERENHSCFRAQERK